MSLSMISGTQRDYIRHAIFTVVGEGYDVMTFQISSAIGTQKAELSTELTFSTRATHHCFTNFRVTRIPDAEELYEAGRIRADIIYSV